MKQDTRLLLYTSLIDDGMENIMKKKLLFTLLVCVMTFAVVACGSSSEEISRMNDLTHSGSADVDNPTGATNDSQGGIFSLGTSQDSNDNMEQSGYIGNMVSNDYICYKEVSTKDGVSIFYDYDDHWNKSWEGFYTKDEPEKPYIENYYFNIYSEGEGIPSDKKYLEGYLWDANGNPIIHYDGHGEIKDTSEYDSNNNKIIWQLWKNGQKTSVYYYEYDENGACTCESLQSKGLNYIDQKQVYTNDENGNRTNTIIRTLLEDGSVKKEDVGRTWEWKYEYDENGWIVRLYDEDPEHGGIEYDYTYEYDNAGHLIVSYDSFTRRHSYYVPKSEFNHRDGISNDDEIESMSESGSSESAIDVVGRYVGGSTTEYILIINSQNGNDVNLDLSWANARTFNEVDTQDVQINGNIISFTTIGHGGHGLEGNEVTFTIVFEGNQATLYWGTLEDHSDTIIVMDKQ